jgi:hypothetical protein
MAKGAETSTDPSPEFVRACKATFDALELKYRLVHDQLASELSNLSAKIASPEFEELKRLNAEMKKAYANFLETGKPPGEEFKSLSKNFSTAVKNFRNSEKFKTEQARLNQAGFTLIVGSDIYWSNYQSAINNHSARAPDLKLRLFDTDTVLEVEAPISTLTEIGTSIGNPHERALNETEPECYKFVRKETLPPKGITNKTGTKASTPPVQGQTAVEPQKKSSDSSAK